MTSEQSNVIEKITRGQSKNKDWYYQEAGRITASVMKRVFSADIDQPSRALINDICYPLAQKELLSESIKWGKKK